MGDNFTWGYKLPRKTLIEKVKEFYKENKIKKEPTVKQELVMARLVLFVEWLQNERPDSETWEDIFADNG
jgi:hypothetical protein